MTKKREVACSHTNPDRLLSDLQSAEAAVRVKALHAVCPCTGDWMAFEQHRDIVARLKKDDCPEVAAAAIHVFEDAAEMESSRLPTSRRETSNEMLRTRRRSRFRADEAESSGLANRRSLAKRKR